MTTQKLMSLHSGEITTRPISIVEYPVRDANGKIATAQFVVEDNEDRLISLESKLDQILIHLQRLTSPN
ncbi:MAG: hypothetical protein KGZ56_01075 [Dethiobacter sp.]|nr:hypothetical protein [Dethiobacter sp.]MBS3898725.1 hypothetical protein [Dethiobacter sp.]